MTRDATADPFNMSTIQQSPIARSTAAWNTKDLGKRLGVDVASAATAGALTCPLITIIDRAIIEKASKGFPIQRTITDCLKSMVSRPSGFFLSTPFLLIYTLYSSTYLTANAIDTLTSTMRNQSYDTVTPGPLKFIATTTVNMAICVYKDARFAKIFGASPPSQPTTTATGQPQQPPSALRAPAPAQAQAPPSTCHPHAAPGSTLTIPKSSYTLFCLRDSITIFASFNIPALIAPSIPDFVASTPGMKSALAQFSCPALMQFASTPMHLLGLDLFNRQPAGGLPWTDRVARIRRDYVPACFARMGKIVPAYGIGGVANVRLRDYLMKRVENRA